jgi:hypothetical protein
MLWGRWKTHGTESGNSAINYWWGMSSGVVDLLLSSELPEGVRALAKVLKAGIQTGTLQPFERRIVTQDGRLINDGTLRPTIDQILKIDWFSDRIHGRLPDYDELLPVAKPLVDRLGLQRK